MDFARVNNRHFLHGMMMDQHRTEFYSNHNVIESPAGELPPSYEEVMQHDSMYGFAASDCTSFSCEDDDQTALLGDDQETSI